MHALDSDSSLQYDLGNVTEFELPEPLVDGAKYSWYVTALSDSGWPIASNPGQLFNVVSTDNFTTVTGRSMWYDQPLIDVEIFAVNEGSNYVTGERNAIGSVDADGYFEISFAGSDPQTIWVMEK